MKILVIHPYSFSEYKGGVERYCKNLEEGFACHKDIEVLQINDNYFRFLGEPLPTIKIFKILKENKPDIIHLHGPHPFATITGIFGKILGAKTVLTYYAPLNPSNSFKRIIAGLDQFILRYVFDYITIISEDYRKFIESFFSFQKIKLVPLLLEEEFLQYTKPKDECRKEISFKNEKVVLFVGRLDRHHYYKGLDVLIKSVKFSSVGFKFVIIGDGEKKKFYQDLASKEGIIDKIDFVGEVTEELLRKYYRAADIFILPSTSGSEGFGFVLIEAMSLETPTITTSIVGSASLIAKREAGIIIPPNNSKVIYEAIEKLIKDKTLYQTLRKNGRALAEEFQVGKNIDKFLEIYNELIYSKNYEKHL